MGSKNRGNFQTVLLEAHQAFLSVQVGDLIFISICFQLDMELGTYIILEKAWEGGLSVPWEFPR